MTQIDCSKIDCDQIIGYLANGLSKKDRKRLKIKKGSKREARLYRALSKILLTCCANEYRRPGPAPADPSTTPDPSLAGVVLLGGESAIGQRAATAMAGYTVAIFLFAMMFNDWVNRPRSFSVPRPRLPCFPVNLPFLVDPFGEDPLTQICLYMCPHLGRYSLVWERTSAFKPCPPFIIR